MCSANNTDSTLKKEKIGFEQRLAQMEKGYLDCLNKGMNIEEIAKKYDVSQSTVYRRLTSIAVLNNLPREALLLRNRGGTDNEDDAKELCVRYDDICQRLEKTMDDLKSIHNSIRILCEKH